MKLNLSDLNSIVILTGAGISAASGLDTFRDKGGLWAKYDYRHVATPNGFARDPEKVYDFYNMRRQQALTVEPNAAHLALAQLEHGWPGDFLLVTQNVDGLHEAAGSQKLLHMHGQLNSALCQSCGQRAPWTTDMDMASICPICAAVGYLRPDVVWFGEIPYHMAEIEAALSTADMFVAIGTSGTVYPAAEFVKVAKAAGAYAVDINLERSDNAEMFDTHLSGPAADTVPAFVAQMLSR